MRAGNWKQTGVAVGCVLGRQHAYFTWAAKLITTLFVFAVLKIDHHTLRVCSSQNPRQAPDQEEGSQEVYVLRHFI